VLSLDLIFIVEGDHPRRGLPKVFSLGFWGAQETFPNWSVVPSTDMVRPVRTGRRFGVPSGILAREPAPSLKRKKSPPTKERDSPEPEEQDLIRSQRPSAVRSSLNLAYKQVIDYFRTFRQGWEKVTPDSKNVSIKDLEGARSKLHQLYSDLKARVRAARGILPPEEVRDMEQRVTEYVREEFEKWDSILSDHLSCLEESKGNASLSRTRKSSDRSRKKRTFISQKDQETILFAVSSSYKGHARAICERLDYLDKRLQYEAGRSPMPYDAEVARDQHQQLRSQFGELIRSLDGCRKVYLDMEYSVVHEKVYGEIEPRYRAWLARLEQRFEGEDREPRVDQEAEAEGIEDGGPSPEDLPLPNESTDEPVLAGALNSEVDPEQGGKDTQEVSFPFLPRTFSSPRTGKGEDGISAKEGPQDSEAARHIDGPDEDEIGFPRGAEGREADSPAPST